MNEGDATGRPSPTGEPSDPAREAPRPTQPGFLPSTAPVPPRKAAKPAKPRKVEKRHRGRKG
jgi:hypothetical protein